MDGGGARYTSGVMAKYAALVTQANEGAIAPAQLTTSRKPRLGTLRGTSFAGSECGHGLDPSCGA